MARLKREISTPLNFEMAATDEMVDDRARYAPARLLSGAGEAQRAHHGRRARCARRPRPPQNRHGRARRAPACASRSSSSRALAAVKAADSIGAPVVELHTGAWCDALSHGESERAAHEFDRMQGRGGARGRSRPRMPCRPRPRFFHRRDRFRRCREIAELNIGHYLIGEAIFVGLHAAIARMRAAMYAGRERSR